MHQPRGVSVQGGLGGRAVRRGHLPGGEGVRRPRRVRRSQHVQVRERMGGRHLHRPVRPWRVPGPHPTQPQGMWIPCCGVGWNDRLTGEPLQGADTWLAVGPKVLQPNSRRDA